jgi:hypothetical protein
MIKSGAALLGGLSFVAVAAAQTGAGSAEPKVVTYQLSRAAAIPAVAPIPIVDLGAGGTENETFSGIVAVRRQASGRIVVANYDPVSIRMFDPNGRFVAAVGRSGRGPGEYMDLTDMVVLPSDSIVVLDRMLRRISLLAPNGTYVSSFPFKPPFTTPPFDVSLQPLGNGSLLIGYAEVSSPKPSPDPLAVQQHAGIYSTTGVPKNAVGKFHVGEYFLQAGFGDEAPFWDRVFGRRGTLLGTGKMISAGDASATEVRRYSTTGSVVEIHRVDRPREPVTRAIIARYRTESLAKAEPSQRSREEKRVAEMPYPTYFPAYRRFLEDAKGRLWLELYGYPAPAPSRWLVLDPGSRQAREVLLPNKFSPHVIGATDILGTWENADGVEHVRLYRLVH